MSRKPVCYVLAALVCHIPAFAVSIPAGTELQLRLTTEVSSDKPSGQPVTAVVIAPVLVNGSPTIGFGTELHGVTADAHANVAGENGTAEQPATVRLQLTTIRPKGGATQPVACVLVGIDNAREAVDQTGLITGIKASQTFTSLADSGINKITQRSGELGQLLAGIKGSLVKKADPSIDYKPGVEFTAKLTKPLNWNSPATPLPGPVTPAGPLLAIVQAAPFRTQALKPPSPSDLTNLMFIGSKEQIQTAFKEAGWFESAALGGSANMRTAAAIIENNGYEEAPMSILTLDGKPPDLTLEKQNNTFASRHHIRIWQLPQTLSGRPVFVAAATHDIKFYFSQTSRSITHGIDPDIDRERTKVLNDMLFANHVAATSLIDRPQVPDGVSNATGDKLQTDKKIAVMELK
jgi:LssY C-terminus